MFWPGLQGEFFLQISMQVIQLRNFFFEDVGVDDKLRHICHDGAGTAQLPCPATCGSIATRVRHNCHEDAEVTDSCHGAAHELRTAVV